MKKFKFTQIFFFALCLTLVASCSKDDDDDDACVGLAATYDGDVAAIINGSCAYAGCHDGTGINTFIPVESNDFTTYADMKSVLDAGSFHARALDSKTMPPAGFVPPGFPAELTDEQLELLTCWHDAGYPES